jgi:phosphomevalonate kinase
MAFELLNDDQVNHLNEIYAGIVRKYQTQSTESLYIETPKRLDHAEGVAIANLEVAAKYQKIENDYNDRVAEIKRNALARGILESTTVVEMLDRALTRKQEAMARLNGIADKLVKKVLNDNAKAILTAEKEKANAKSRAIRDFIAMTRMKIVTPYAEQTLIDNELYTAYRSWLLQFTPRMGYYYVRDNVVFLTNMGTVKYVALRTEMNDRWGG